jgi:hypothetical protein
VWTTADVEHPLLWLEAEGISSMTSSYRQCLESVRFKSIRFTLPDIISIEWLDLLPYVSTVIYRKSSILSHMPIIVFFLDLRRHL